MITIAFDEEGRNFEGPNEENEALFIGGLIYDDGFGKDRLKESIAEQNAEKKRIADYYQRVINDVSLNLGLKTNYPKSLHSGNAFFNRSVGPTKTIVTETLGEFLTKGTYRGEKIGTSRNGKYSIFVLLKSTEGMNLVFKSQDNFLVSDNTASNLYFHMTSRMIRRILFNNPYTGEIDNVSIMFPTRSLPTENFSGEEKTFYEHNYSKNSEGTVYEITNKDIFKTMLQEELVYAEKTDINFVVFNVKSINYNSSKANCEFLYLADSVCSILGFKLENTDDNKRILEIDNRARNLIKNNRIIFGYDRIEADFSKAWEKYIEEDYYSSLSIAWNILESNSKFKGFYKKYWISLLENRIVEGKNLLAFKMAVQKLSETINTNRLNQKKTEYIFGVIEKLSQNIKISLFESERVLYKLYDIGLSINCHKGDSVAAEKYLNLCALYADRVGLESYLSTRNKYTVLLNDSLAFSRALEIATENLEYNQFMQEINADIRNKIQVKDVTSTNDVALGKAYSQLAQVYAYMRNQKAEGLFKNALDLFEKTSADYKITQSYLLHFYCDMRMEDKYKDESRDYFGNRETLIDQLNYIINEYKKEDPIFNIQFAIFIFVKGVSTFFFNSVNSELWRKLERIEELFNEKKKDKSFSFGVYPGVLIYKYLLYIAKNKGKEEAFKTYYDKIYQYSDSSGIIHLILLYTKYICETLNETSDKDESSSEFFKYLIENFSEYKNTEFIDNLEDRFAFIEGILSYMYI